MMVVDTAQTMPMRTSRRHGFTVIEMMIVVAVFSALIAYVLIGLRQQMHLTAFKEYIQDLDMQGSRIMQELTFQLRPAILPVYTDPADDSDDRKVVFELLDSTANGFRAAGGQGKAWLNSLQGGMESIAFVVPVDAQGDQDAFDDENHMEVGQRRSSGVSLDSEFITSLPDGFLLVPGEVPCSLVRVSPANLDNDAIGGAANISGWPGALYNGTPPKTSAFSVIRYVPATEGGSPRLINEAAIGVDLNGDGVRNATFNIGKLQLVHVGGNHAVQPPTPGFPDELSLAHETIDLSADVVLRDVNLANRVPIFQLQAGDALAVRVNLFNPERNEALRAQASFQQRNDLNREFETVLTLRNMAR